MYLFIIAKLSICKLRSYEDPRWQMECFAIINIHRVTRKVITTLFAMLTNLQTNQFSLCWCFHLENSWLYKYTYDITVFVSSGCI